MAHTKTSSFSISAPRALPTHGVEATTAAPTALPDPTTISESIIRRTEYKSHLKNVSSILWYRATITIHGSLCDDLNIVLPGSLAISWHQTGHANTIRTLRGGELKPDAYADKRLLGMPPGVSVILIIYNRFHNHAADNLAAINESGRFMKPSVAGQDNQSNRDTGNVMSAGFNPGYRWRVRIDPSIRLRRAIHANDQLLVARILKSHPYLLHNPDTSAAGLSNSNLHLAASLGHVQICQLLVNLGHEHDGPALNENRETSLILAARGGHIEAVHYLCQTNADWILAQDAHGRDALMEASRGGHDTVVQILLTYVPGGAEDAVRREDKEGNTALHFASSNGHLLVLRTLLAAGADAEHKNVWCWTPVAYSASVQAEVYLKGLVNQNKAQAQTKGQAVAHVAAPAQSRRWKFGTGDSSNKAKSKAAAAGVRIVRDDDK